MEEQTQQPNNKIGRTVANSRVELSEDEDKCGCKRRRGRMAKAIGRAKDGIKRLIDETKNKG